MATKLERGGGEPLVAGPLKKTVFFSAIICLNSHVFFFPFHNKQIPCIKKQSSIKRESLSLRENSGNYAANALRGNSDSNSGGRSKRRVDCYRRSSSLFA